MRILYGVVGEGMGHAIRSRVVVQHLRDHGHDVRIVVSGNAARYLERHFGEVLSIEGMRMVFDQNRVHTLATAKQLICSGLRGLPKNVAAYFQLLRERFDPELVISDFESWSYFYGKRHGLPIISIDNMQMINRCSLPSRLTPWYRGGFQLARALVRSKLPYCDHYLLTSFFKPPVKKEKTTVHPPLLRPEVLEREVKRGDHLVVYQSAGDNRALTDALYRTGVECRAYGLRPDVREDMVEGNLVHRPFDEESFLEDLASCRAVVGTAGATLMSETVHFGKPMLAAPILGQFEQELNASCLQRMGYGRRVDHVDAQSLGEFMASLPAYEDSLAGYDSRGNGELLGMLDRKLVELVGTTGPGPRELAA